jgi:NADP-dependent 3-hydroxy acid dehydrogenase YdfG
MDIATDENLPLQDIQLDVNNEKYVTDAIDRIVKEKGDIDVVVNNHMRICTFAYKFKKSKHEKLRYLW